MTHRYARTYAALPVSPLTIHAPTSPAGRGFYAAAMVKRPPTRRASSFENPVEDVTHLHMNRIEYGCRQVRP
jgi:hypothetical protein